MSDIGGKVALWLNEWGLLGNWGPLGELGGPSGRVGTGGPLRSCGNCFRKRRDHEDNLPCPKRISLIVTNSNFNVHIYIW